MPQPIDFFLLTTTDLGASQALTDHWDLNGRADVRPGKESPLDEIATKLAARLS